MSPVKTKTSFIEEKINKDAVNKACSDDIRTKLTRPPLYPDLTKEKENMGLSSSADSPEKFRYNRSPLMPRKSNSPSSTDSMSDIPGSPKRRSEKFQQNQMNNIQDSNDSDMEIDNYPNNQGQEDSEIFPESYKMKIKGTRNRKPNQPKMQPQTTKPSDSTSESTIFSPENSMYLILPCIVLICVVLILCSSVYWPKHSVPSHINDQFNASTLVNSLKSKFGNQPRLTYRIIHSALKNALVEQPEAPAIILLLATNGSETVCRELAHSLVNSLSVPDHTVKISGKTYRQGNTNQAKKQIDETISHALKNGQLGSVLIEDLDQIPGNAAVILHKYSDHENAPFKKAVFVMTVNYNKEISDYSDTKVWDKAAYDHLLSAWTDVGIDQATPLLTRLTVSVAVIQA